MLIDLFFFSAFLICLSHKGSAYELIRREKKSISNPTVQQTFNRLFTSFSSFIPLTSNFLCSKQSYDSSVM